MHDEYDENGTLRKFTILDENDQVENVYEYDEHGGLRKTIAYRDGELYSTMEYDEHGEMIKMITSDSELYCTNEYDENGNLIKETSNSEGRKTYRECEYDENGNCIRENHIDDGILSWEYKYEYDENGNCIKKINYNENGEIEMQHEKEYIAMEVRKKIKNSQLLKNRIFNDERKITKRIK